MLLWFVIIYWIISVGIGLWAALRVKNTADFAAAGGHNKTPLLSDPVFGKTTLARRIPSILPPLGFKEVLHETAGA